MSEATSNLTSIEADSIKQWDPVVKRYVDLRDSVVGLAPETLDTLEKIAASIGDDPDYAVAAQYIELASQGLEPEEQIDLLDQAEVHFSYKIDVPRDLVIDNKKRLFRIVLIQPLDLIIVDAGIVGAVLFQGKGDGA